MKKSILFILTFGLAVAVLPCAPKSGISEIPPYGIEKSEYQQMLDKTLVNVGNNYRLKNVIEKIKKGQDVYICALGGSVTEGAGPADYKDGYAYQFFRAMTAAYCPKGKNNIHFNNAGLSGTPSSLGRIRYQSDVVDVLGRLPDLLIVEFAVNDGGEELYVRSYEAIVRDALLASPDTAVIGLYSAATYGNTSFQKKPVSDYYSIPHVNMLDLVNESIKNKKFTKEQYYTDIVHPTKEGHQLMSDCLLNLIAKVDAEKMDKAVAVPEKPLKEPSFSGLVRVVPGLSDKNVQIAAGDFDHADQFTQGLKKTNNPDFPNNWHKIEGSGQKGQESGAFKMKLNCKSLFLVYKVQGSWLKEKFGKAQIFVDGRLFGEYDGGKAGGWNNCEVLCLIDQKEAGEHEVEVKMSSGSEDKAFTIVAMGYCNF